MDRRRDKLGEYVMVAEEFNRYEEFALLSGNFTTLDQAHGDVTGQGTFELYYENGNPSGDEKRVLVHSDYVYGENRQIVHLVFDVVYSSSLWQRSVSGDTTPNGWLEIPWEAELYLKIRPVLTDFDPASITWNSAYGGGSPLSFGTMASINAMGEAGWSTLAIRCIDGNPPPVPVALAELDENIEVQGLLATRTCDIGSMVYANWNAESAIYGWEIAVSTDGNGEFVRWTGDVEISSAFVILK